MRGNRGGKEKDLLSLEKRVENITNLAGDIKVHLAYPNTYWVGMSNLGFQAVYSLFSAAPTVMVERAFLPDDFDIESEKKEKFKTFESKRLLGDCDLIGFSLSFETDYTNMLSMLGNAGCLFRTHDERAKAHDAAPFGVPLIVVGGTGVTLNPEPIADFVDIIVLGEAEELIPELVMVLEKGKKEGFSREQLLLEASTIEGVYIPKFYHATYAESGSVEGFTHDLRVPARPQRRFVKDLSKFPTYTKIMTPETEFKSMFLTETGRGCEMGCRFCVAGYIYRPVRKRSEASLAETVKIGLENSAAIGFVGASVSSHKSIAKLAKSVADAGGRASLSSLMSQKVNKILAASISESEYKTVALAPEAGSERLRRAAGKRVSNEQVIKAAADLAESGIRGFKLYFIVGLPTENDEDTAAIAALATQIRDAVTLAAGPSPEKKPWVQLSVNPFIPKASTPFQWEPMLSLKELDRKIDQIRTLIKKVHNLEMRFEPPKESFFQALLSRGDRRVAWYLYEAWKQRKDWKWIMKQAEAPGEIPPVEFYISRTIPFDEPLPWEIVDSKISRQLLMRENLRARHGEEYLLPKELQELDGDYATGFKDIEQVEIQCAG